MSKKVRDRARWHFGFFSEKTWFWTFSLFIWNAKEKKPKVEKGRELRLFYDDHVADGTREVFICRNPSLHIGRTCLFTCSLYSSRSDDLFDETTKPNENNILKARKKSLPVFLLLRTYFSCFYENTQTTTTLKFAQKLSITESHNETHDGINLESLDFFFFFFNKRESECS